MSIDLSCCYLPIENYHIKPDNLINFLPRLIHKKSCYLTRDRKEIINFISRIKMLKESLIRKKLLTNKQGHA